jgi:hypothetical protein
MAARRMLKRSLFFATLLVVLLVVSLPMHAPVSEKELARRVMRSDPAWNNYDEDLKAQLGAAAVAEWEGKVTRIQWVSGVLQVSFIITGPWEQREFAIPILLQLPDSKIFRNDAAVREENKVTYRFSTASEEPPQWVVVRYPFYGERRIVLNDEGVWEFGQEE